MTTLHIRVDMMTDILLLLCVVHVSVVFYTMLLFIPVHLFLLLIILLFFLFKKLVLVLVLPFVPTGIRFHRIQWNHKWEDVPHVKLLDTTNCVSIVDEKKKII